MTFSQTAPNRTSGPRHNGIVMHVKYTHVFLLGRNFEPNRKSHQNNKRHYDRRAKARDFKESDLVYLYKPAKNAT